MAALRQQIATNVLRVTRFRDLLNAVRAYRPNDDLALIRKAYDYSLQYHTGQQRASGEPYLVHPLEVACMLAEIKMDPIAIAGGLLDESYHKGDVVKVKTKKAAKTKEPELTYAATPE